jgi:hypothetical protein
MMKLNGKSIITKLVQPVAFVFIGAFSRLIPHPANFAPIAAMAIFGGVYLGRKQALTIPLAAMILSDLFLGFDSVAMRLSVYGSFLLTVFIGFWLKKHKNYKYIILASLASSLLFFLITNFTVWAVTNMYPKSLSGLIESYFYAIPFFRNTVLGDLTYSGVFFGGYELVKKLILKTSPLWVWR